MFNTSHFTHKSVNVGYTAIIENGVTGVLHAGRMDFSSVFIGKVYKNGENLCSLMSHRGKETFFDFRYALDSILSPYGHTYDLILQPIAVQTGPYPCVLLSRRLGEDNPRNIVKSFHDRTDIELVHNMSSIFNLDREKLYDMIEDGPGIDSVTNTSTACVDKFGEIYVEKRIGMFQLLDSGGQFDGMKNRDSN